MVNVLKYALVIICFMLMPAKAYPDDASLSSGHHDPRGHKEKIQKRAKNILSALLFLQISGQGKRVVRNHQRLTLPSDSEGTLLYLSLPTLHDIYQKYGFDDSVQQKLQHFSKHKYSFRKKLELSGKYVKQMKKIFSERGLPHELVYLPLIESGFNPYAISHKRASGPWQFMRRTAENLGLRVDQWVDERRDPVKSTRAAAEYLQYLHGRFGSWNLALAAYNAGEGNVMNALQSVSKKDFRSIQKSPYIKMETINYVPSYIAAAAIAMHPEKFGFTDIAYHRPRKFDEVIVHRPIDFDVIAQLAQVEVREIRDLNPELRQWCTPPDSLRYRLRIPKGSKNTFLENYSRVRGDELDLVRFYKVSKGDTVEKIAKKLGTSMHEIMMRNDLGRRALLHVGRNILVPFEQQWNSMFIN